VPIGPVYHETNSANTYNGAYTLRLDPTSHAWDAFDYAPFVACYAGEHFHMSVALKAGGSGYVYQQGAWLGLDYYNGFAQTRITGISTSQEAGLGQDNVGVDKDNSFVHWGTGWTVVTWDWVVPANAVSDSTGHSASIGSFIPWIERVGNQGSIWASDFQLTITS